jgi:hypothetical protein
MRCLLCATEMTLKQVVADNSMPVPGFERHTFECPSCGDVEQRLIFNRHAQDEAQPVQVSAPPVSPPAVPAHNETAASQAKHDEVTAPPASPSALSEGEQATAASVWARALAKLRGR